MPARPPPYEWSLPEDTDVRRFDASADELCRELGGVLETCEAREHDRVAVLRFGRQELMAALSTLECNADDVDPVPGDLYRIEVQWLARDEESPLRLRIPWDARDNWAAAALAGPVGSRLAGMLGGTDITGDPPAWLVHELRRNEPLPPAELPFIAIRRSALFPGHASVLQIGRRASLATIRGLVAAGQDQFVACMQRDPAGEPTRIDDFFPIAMAMRLLSATSDHENVLVIAKGLCRVHVRELLEGGRVKIDIVREQNSSSAEIEDLRDVARFDPLIEASAGISAVAASAALPPGSLCDFIAAHGERPEAYAPVLQAVALDERIRATRTFFGRG